MKKKHENNIIVKICKRYGYTYKQCQEMSLILLEFFGNCIRIDEGREPPFEISQDK